MTAKRIDNDSTQFGLWLRKQPEIDSYKGYRASNIDYVWTNVNCNYWMIIEEKRYLNTMKPFQEEIYKTVVSSIKDENFKGFHLLVFEKTNPDDGDIYLDNKKITRDELISFLQFGIKDNSEESFKDNSEESFKECFEFLNLIFTITLPKK